MLQAKSKLKLSLALIGALTATTAMAVEMTDYKFVDSYFDESYVGAQFDLKDGNQDQMSYNGTFTGDYKAKFSTLPYAWDIDMDAQADISRGSNSDDEKDESYQINATGHFDSYFEKYENVFVYGMGDLGYRKLPGIDDADDPYIAAGAGIGYGRIYDATPLAKTLRITEDLKKYNLIGDLSDEGYIKVAQIIDKEAEFVSKYGVSEYKKFWFQAIEDQLRSSGALTGELGAFGIVRMQEILFEERVSARYHGWLVRAGVGKIFSNYDGESEDPTLDLEFEYGLPIGYKAQFYDKAKYSTLLNDDTGHVFENRMSYTYEISDRIDWENNWNFQYTKPSDSALEDVMTNTLASTFRYYIANRLSFDTTLSFKNVEDNIDNNGNDDWETRVMMGVSYRLK